MNLETFNKWVGIFANIGVLAGIIFLALELQQNNLLLEAEARRSRAETSQAVFLRNIENPHLVEAMVSESVDPFSSQLRFAYFQYVMVGWQYSYREFEAGLIDEESLQARAWAFTIETITGFEEHWDNFKFGYDSDFVNYIDAIRSQTDIDAIRSQLD